MVLHQYSFPTDIQQGHGAIELLPGVLAGAGCARPLFVTDRGLSALPAFALVLERLDRPGLAARVFSGVWGNPVKSQVTAGVAAYREHRADAVVAIGGGAAIDVAKAIALMVHHPGDLFDYEDEKPGARPIDGKIPYFVAVPTTAGTGSEVGRSTVVSDDETHVKKIIFSPRLMAKKVLLDPDLTMGLPAGVTAATGMDALTHLVEAYLAKGFQPMCDGIALQGVRIVAQSLARCVKLATRMDAEPSLSADATHREVRGAMMTAALMGGVAFQKGLGVTHSLAHALSTVSDLHHGLANGVMIPYAMEFNAASARTRMEDLARAASAPTPDAEGLVAWLVELRAEIGIPHTLRALGVQRESVDRLVEVATADVCHKNNPRNVSADDFRSLFTRALG